MLSIFYDKYRDRRIIWPVIIFTFLLPDIYADPILSARKESDFVHQSQNHRRCKYKERSCLPFSAEIKPVLKPEYWSRLCREGMIAARKIAEIENNAAYTICLGILRPYLHGIPKEGCNFEEHAQRPAFLWWQPVPVSGYRKPALSLSFCIIEIIKVYRCHFP